MAQYVKVIQKNKGTFKNFLKKIEQIQDYKATCGIHENDGRKRVKHRNIKKPKGNGNLKPKKNSDIDDAKKRVSSSRKKQLNLATLSSILEQHITWRQSKTAIFQPALGGPLTAISADETKIRRKPARIHIHLERSSSAWTDVQNIVQSECILYLTKLQSSRGKMAGQNLFKEIAEKVAQRQRQRIINKETAGNSDLTMQIKGFNFPLFDKGTLLSSIKGRVVRNSTGRKVRCAYIADNIDEIIRRINSSVR